MTDAVEDFLRIPTPLVPVRNLIVCSPPEESGGPLWCAYFDGEPMVARGVGETREAAIESLAKMLSQASDWALMRLAKIHDESRP